VVNTRLTRQLVEVLGAAPLNTRLTRQLVEVLGTRGYPSATRLTRQMIEVLGDEDFSPSITPLDLPDPVTNYFMANWKSAISVRTSWSTDVTKSADDGGEERRSLVERPYRTLQVQLTAMDQAETQKLWMNLNRMAHSRGPVPLFCDHSRLTGSASGFSIPCDTTYRRFYAGGRVAIHSWSGNRPANVEYHLVESVAPTSLTLQTTPTHSFVEGDRVIPMLDCEINLQASGLFITRELLNVQLTVNEVPGLSALPSSIGIDGELGNPLFEGDPIFVSHAEWSTGVSAHVVREGRDYALGLGQVVYAEGDRPQQRYDVDISKLTRESFWSVKRFFDWRRGRGRPFWFLNPSNLFELVDIQSTYADVTAQGNVEDVETFIEAVGFESRDGTITMARVSSVTDNGSTWRLNFSTALSSVPASVWRSTSAHHVRFTGDELEELWENDQVVSAKMSMIDVINEATVTFDATDDDLDDDNEIDAISDLYAWFALHKNAKTGSDEPPIPKPFSKLASEYRLEVVRDVRDDAQDGALELRAYGSTACDLAFFDKAKLNNGYPFVYADLTDGKPGFFLANAADQGDGANGDVPWGYANAGFTVFAAFIAGASMPSGLNFTILQLTNPSSQTLLAWYGDQVKIYETAGVSSSGLWITPSTSEILRSGPVILALRIEIGVASRLYVSGVLNASASTAVTGLPLTSIIVPTYGSGLSNSNLIFSAANGGDGRDSQYGSGWFFNEMLMFSRSLSDTEMNTVGQYLSGKYLAPWTDL